jgi:hypothetical protein
MPICLYEIYFYTVWQSNSGEQQQCSELPKSHFRLMPLRPRSFHITKWSRQYKVNSTYYWSIQNHRKNIVRSFFGETESY